MELRDAISDEFDNIKQAIYHFLESQRCYVASLQAALEEGNETCIKLAFDEILDTNQKIGDIFDIDNLSSIEEINNQAKVDIADVDEINRLFSMESPH